MNSTTIPHKLLLRFNDLVQILDELSTIIKSIHALQQQPTDNLDQFIQQCENKIHELTQHARQAITDVSPALHPDDIRQLIEILNLLELQWINAERVLGTFTRRDFNYQNVETNSIRFIQWFEYFLNYELNHRLDGLTLQSSLEILKTDIRNILINKRRLVNELLNQAHILQSTDQVQLQNVEQLKQIMNTTEQHVEERIKNTEISLIMLTDFEQDVENISSWMDSIEINLQNANEMLIHQKSITSIEIDIEKYSTIIHNLVTIGHNLLNKNNIPPRKIDSISRTVQTLEQRWIRLKDLIYKIMKCTKFKENLINSNTPTRIDQLLTDYEEILREISGDCHLKEEQFHSPIPIGVQIEKLTTDFSYNKLLISTRRKIDALRELIRLIQRELGAYFIHDLEKEPVVVDIMNKWNHLQTLANAKDDQLKQNRKQWKDFKKHLDDLEQAEHLLSQINYSKFDVHRQLDEFQILLKSVIDLGKDFYDNSNEWMLIECRIQSLKDKFQVLLTKTNHQHRKSKINSNIKEDLLEINSQLDHLESLIYLLEPVDHNEINSNINRTKFNRFIHIQNDLETVNERLINLNDRSQNRIINDLNVIFDRLNSIKTLVRIYLEQLEKLLTKMN